MDDLTRSIAADYLKDGGFEEAAELINPSIMKVDWRHSIKLATDRNIIVIDNDAVSGRFTRRLIALMKTVQRRNAGSNLSHLLVPMEAFMDLLVELNINSETESVTIFGIFVQGSYDFSFGDHGDLNHFYLEECGGSMPSHKEEIVIGMSAEEKDEKKRYLLGAI